MDSVDFFFPLKIIIYIGCKLRILVRYCDKLLNSFQFDAICFLVALVSHAIHKKALKTTV